MQITSDEVIEAVRNVTPGTVRVHVVEINGVDYPVNQVFSIVTGTDPSDCNSGVARKKFKKLGFPVKRVG